MTTFYQAIRHYAEGNLDAALAAAQAIAGQGELYAQAARWLAKVAQGGETSPYLEADAFAAFIRGGGNVALYDAVERMVTACRPRMKHEYTNTRRPIRVFVRNSVTARPTVSAAGECPTGRTRSRGTLPCRRSQ